MEKDDIEILVALIEGNEQFLQMLVDSGIAVGVFERKDLALADLLERILQGADDA